MDITVIGHLCVDNVHLPSGTTEHRVVKSFGGIAFSIATLAHLAEKEDTIAPVVAVGEDQFDEFTKWVSQFPSVDPKGIYKIEGMTNEVHLFYDETGGGRTECSRHISPAIPFDVIKPFLNCSGILINMISGFDISLETLDRIRMEVRDRGVPIHFDFHALTLGIDNKFQRFRRPLSDWRRWCFMINSIQMSEVEASGLTAERYKEKELIDQLMPLMVNALLITRGERGVTLIRQEHKKLQRRELPGIEIPDAIDPTGCGDIFGAGFFHYFLRSHDFLESAAFANRLAAQKVRFSGPDGISQLTEFTKVKQPT